MATEMVIIPAGPFWMGSEEGERPKRLVHLDTFSIDKFEVTNRQFQIFLESIPSQAKPSFWTDSTWNAALQPVVGVTWFDAQAYCKWVGKRLPTEAEWEKAARGTDYREYPWGGIFDEELVNSSETNIKQTVPVTSFPRGVSPYGIYNMAGNVQEWVADIDSGYEKNITGSVNEFRIVRGGSWASPFYGVRTARRISLSPRNRHNDVGFRCAQ
jgi:formylglycine-generating enzyme required for sulfatase activity